MALGKNQKDLTLELFVKAYNSETDATKRKELIIQFEDAFDGCIADWEGYVVENINEDLKEEFQEVVDRNSNTDFLNSLTIENIVDEDLQQISQLGIRNLDLMAWVSDSISDKYYDSWKRFLKDGYSFTVKKNEEILGFALANKWPTYGGYYDIYLDTLVVDKAVQGRGVGTMLINNLKKIVHKENAFRILLRTDKKIPAFQIYKHWGFKETKEDEVYMSIWC